MSSARATERCATSRSPNSDDQGSVDVERQSDYFGLGHYLRFGSGGELMDCCRRLPHALRSGVRRHVAPDRRCLIPCVRELAFSIPHDVRSDRWGPRSAVSQMSALGATRAHQRIVFVRGWMVDDGASNLRCVLVPTVLRQEETLLGPRVQLR